jgi:hypothetical protein
MVLEAVHCVLLSLISFNPKTRTVAQHGRALAATLGNPRPPSGPQGPILRQTTATANGTPVADPPKVMTLAEFDFETNGSEISELLAESRMLRARMKELQEK